MKYIGIRNREYSISETQMIGKGREGRVYRAQSDSGESVAVKLYSEDLLSDHDYSNQLEIKLKSLISKPVVETFGVFSIAWPRDLVYKEEGGKRWFAGYVQRIVDGNCTLSNIIRNKFPNDHGDGSGGKKSLTWNQAIKAAYNLAYFVAYLHSMGIILGDFNENNFLFNDKTGGYGLIDCGNYGLVDKTQNIVLFPSNFIMPNYRAPESILGIATDNPFSSDYFFLAVHIFNILSVNANPFRYVSEDLEKNDDYSIEDAIVNGECLYVRRIPGKKLPEDAPTAGYFPRDIMFGFENTFLYSKSSIQYSISQRTTAEEWCTILRPYFDKEKSFVQYDYRVGIKSPAVHQSSGDRLDLQTRRLAEQMIGSYTRGDNSTDYYFDRLYPEKGAELTRQGTKKTEIYFGVENLNDPLNAELKKSIIAAINNKEANAIKLEPKRDPSSMPKNAGGKTQAGTGIRKPGPNDPCPCGSGLKYKNCHGKPAGNTSVPLPNNSLSTSANLNRKKPQNQPHNLFSCFKRAFWVRKMGTILLGLFSLFFLLIFIESLVADNPTDYWDYLQTENSFRIYATTVPIIIYLFTVTSLILEGVSWDISDIWIVEFSLGLCIGVGIFFEIFVALGGTNRLLMIACRLISALHFGYVSLKCIGFFDEKENKDNKLEHKICNTHVIIGAAVIVFIVIMVIKN